MVDTQLSCGVDNKFGFRFLLAWVNMDVEFVPTVGDGLLVYIKILGGYG